MQRSISRVWIENFIDAFGREKDNLGEMDRISGDGDFAINLESALKFCAAELGLIADDATDGEVFSAVSNGFLKTGGTSGPLLGMWVRDVAKALSSGDDLVSAFASGFTDGVATVQRIGGARQGDKTMVDAMLPAADALREAAESGSDLAQALTMAADAARAGAEGTAEVAASMGRASYVGDVSLGVTDPGACAIALFFDSGAQAAKAV